MTVFASDTVKSLLKQNSGVTDEVKTPEQIEEERLAAEAAAGAKTPEQIEQERLAEEEAGKVKTPEQIEEERLAAEAAAAGGEEKPKIVINEEDNLFFDNPAANAEELDENGKPKAPVIPSTSKYSEFENDSDFEALFQLKKAKKGGFVDLAKEIKIVDYENMSAEDLIRLDCIAAGVTDEDEIKAEVASFNGLGARAKQKQEGELRSAMILKQEADLKAKVKGDYESSIENPELVKKRLEKLDQTFAEAVNGMKGKVFLNMPIEDAHIDEFKTYVRDFIPKVLDKEGNLNINIVRGIFLREKFLAEALAAIKGDARAEGRSNILKELGRFGKVPEAGSGQQTRRETKPVDNAGGNALAAFNKHRQTVQPGGSQVKEGLVAEGS